jgi:D-alanyl-D-alanine carboxypeptidase
MMKTGYTFLLSLLLPALSQAQPFQQKVQRFVDSVYQKNPKATGFLLHVEAPDKHISFSYSVGFADRNTRQNVSADQPVLIASNTKPYVASAILKLMESHKLDINEPVRHSLTVSTNDLLRGAGYQTDSITIKHLLSHTSGLRDYVDESYFSFISSNKHYEWTRNEQIARAVKAGPPLAAAGKGFRYADINYILLTEIIEQKTKRPFYQAIRSLLKYKKLHLHNTWFAKLEKRSRKTRPQPHQYWDKFGWDTYDLDPSWDLYGGGGMVATVKDMARFFQQLFTGKVIRNKQVLNLMTEDVPPNLEINYCLGIRKVKYAGFEGYNHGGGLGSDVIYIPQLNASIAMVALEAEHRPLALEISKEIVRLLSLY